MNGVELSPDTGPSGDTGEHLFSGCSLVAPAQHGAPCTAPVPQASPVLADAPDELSLSPSTRPGLGPGPATPYNLAGRQNF